MLISDLITDLISDFGIASILNYTIRSKFGTILYGMIDMEAIQKLDIKSDIKFDISTKPTTWIGHEEVKKFVKSYQRLLWTVSALHISYSVFRFVF